MPDRREFGAGVIEDWMEAIPTPFKAARAVGSRVEANRTFARAAKAWH